MFFWNALQTFFYNYFSEILLTFLKRDLIGGSDLSLNLHETVSPTEILLICLKNRSDSLIENIENNANREYPYLVKYPEYYLQTFKQINDYFIFMINEKKPIGDRAHFKTILKILKLNPENIYLENLFHYIEHFANENKNESLDPNMQEKKNLKQKRTKINFILQILKVLTSSYASTEEKSGSLVNFFQKSYKMIIELLRSPETLIIDLI